MRPFIALLCLAAGAAHAQSIPDAFIDDRSSPERVVTSLYNAIDRGEYLRAWSYFREGAAKPYGEFRDGYEGTAGVELRIGEVSSEGAAGSIHSAVPVAIRAMDRSGAVTVFVGCYRLTQVQPGVQDEPPYRPIQIDGGSLAPVREPFEAAMGTCPDG